MSEHLICLCHTEHDKMCISHMQLKQTLRNILRYIKPSKLAYTKLNFKRPSHITMILKYFLSHVRLNVSMSSILVHTKLIPGYNKTSLHVMLNLMC